MRPMRFCMVTTFYPPHSFGGDAIFVDHLSRALVERGHRVDVVHNVDAHRALGGQPGEPPTPLPGLTIHPLRSGWGALSPLLTHQLGRPVGFDRELREILTRPYDVVHFHNASLMGAPRALGYSKGLRLYTTHEAWLVCPTHTLFRFDRAPCERPHCVACALVHKRPPQPWRATGALERAARGLDAVISPSRSNIEIHRARGMDLPFVHVPNFVPHDAAGSAGLSRTNDGARPYFLYVGRLERLKGPQTLVPLFERFAEADLVIAGRGSLEAELRRRAPAGRVRFVGHQSPEGLRSLYRGAVAVVVPSLCYEVFPLVVLEALRDRTPVLVRRRGALTEIATESGGGWTWSDESELVAQMRRLLAEPELANRLGETGHRHALEHWSVERHLERYFDLLTELSARSPRSA